MIKTFITENGLPIPAATVEQMIEIDRIAVEETGPNLFQMMENAGKNLADLVITKAGTNWRAKEIVVLAGTGGNGGGGICAARHLTNRGANVKVCVTDEGNLQDVPAYQLRILKNTDAGIIPLQKINDTNPDIIIDAIIGYSLNGEPAGNALKMIVWAESHAAIIISLDVPSGVFATSGKTAKHFIKPDMTLTLALPKTGLLPEITGELYLGDIGIPKNTYYMAGIDLSHYTFNYKSILKLNSTC